MQAMRVVVILLMMVLLPVRGWLGDAMAIPLSTSSPLAHNHVAISAYSISASGTFYTTASTGQAPCHPSTDAQTHPVNHSADHLGALDDCSQCSQCQICHGAALMALTNALTLVAKPSQVVACGLARFASVPHPPRLKPPIS